MKKGKGYFAIYANGELFIDTKIIFNSKTYYASKENDGIGKCKFFENKSDIYKYYNIIDPEIKLYKFEVSNSSHVYVMASNENDAKDMASDWVKSRHFGGFGEYITGFGEIIAEVSNTGRGDKFLYKP